MSRTSHTHRNGNVIILMKFSSLAAPNVAKMTTFSAASDENFVKMTTFPFQWQFLCAHDCILEHGIPGTCGFATKNDVFSTSARNLLNRDFLIEIPPITGLMIHEGLFNQYHQYLCIWFWYSALPIYRGLFTSNNSRETPISRLLGQAMCVLLEILAWPKFNLPI